MCGTRTVPQVPKRVVSLTFYESRTTHHGSRFSAEPLLPQRLEQHDRGAIRQIQRTRLIIEHWNAQPPVAIIFQQLPRQSSRFPAKYQIVVWRVTDFGIVAGTVGFNEPKPCAARQLISKHRPARPAKPLEVL